jgi:hypothetical protein
VPRCQATFPSLQTLTFLIEIQACGSSNRSCNRGIRSCDWISSIDTDEGRSLARSEDKYRRVCRKLIHHMHTGLYRI